MVATKPTVGLYKRTPGLEDADPKVDGRLSACSGHPKRYPNRISSAVFVGKIVRDGTKTYIVGQRRPL
jgi:hypothetical protein